MNQKDFDLIVQSRILKIQKILTAKASEYAHGDRLSNFKSAASLLECTPEMALFSICTKHIVALKDFINELEMDAPERPLEYWDEKTGDIINYMILLEALVIERLGNEETETP